MGERAGGECISMESNAENPREGRRGTGRGKREAIVLVSREFIGHGL